MGFGQLPDELGDRSFRIEEVDDVTPFYASALMVADALQFSLDAVRFETDYAVATEAVKVATGAIEPGTVCVVRMRYIGESAGRDVLVNQWVWRTTDDVKPEWGLGEYWEMVVEGDPTMNCRLEAKTLFDSKRIVSLVVATNVVNSIPALCEASVGVKSSLDLPLIGGGIVAPSGLAT